MAVAIYFFHTLITIWHGRTLALSELAADSVAIWRNLHILATEVVEFFLAKLAVFLLGGIENDTSDL